MLHKITSKLGIGKSRAKVILDTNFLMLPGSKGLDIFTEIQRLMNEPYDLYVLTATFTELENIAKGNTATKTKGADKFNAKLAFVMAKQKGLKTLRSSSKNTLVDDQIIDLANEQTYVATLDKGLQKRLEKKQAHIITVRQNRLVFKV